MVGEQLVLPKYQETAYTNGHYAADHATNGRHPTTEDRPDDGDEESALLSAAAPKSDGAAVHHAPLPGFASFDSFSRPTRRTHSQMRAKRPASAQK